MIRNIFLALYAAAAINASTISTHDTRETPLSLNKVMLLHQNGTTQIIDQATWFASLEAAGVLTQPPEIDEAFLNFTVPSGTTNGTGRLGKRAECAHTTSVVTDTTQRFVDWDVQMSPVVCAVGDMDISVTKGYTIANSVSVSGSGDPAFISEYLKTSFGVDFGRTWTTQASITTKGTISDGDCGVMITQPLTTRRYGSTYTGCPGSLEKIGTWTADAHSEGSYAGIDWVSGAISICTKTQTDPPLTRCNGEGEFV